MKRIIISLITSGLFVVVLVLNLNTSKTTFTEEAFATKVTCCHEDRSVCVIHTTVIYNHYLVKSDWGDLTPCDQGHL
ncbi:MAG: hypothetical protein AAF611_01355 [Bacteroidota bacterium]